MSGLPFRQIHLDFHTSEAIEGIGKDFSRQDFQEKLKLGHVDSITVFAKCHHGWAYFPSETNEMHPGLSFDLLGEMIAAAHEIGVKTPVYISAGLDEKMARRHPEWLFRDCDESTRWVRDFMTPGYHRFCFNTPYLDYLIPQAEEVARKYDCDGIFLDIVAVQPCYCQHCIASLREAGRDPANEADILWLAEKVYANYADRINAAIHAIKPGLRIFHNGGHIQRGRRDLANKNTHLELESLPTGGWGYDHFPLSARYAATLGMEYLGMTGKFHTFWGEFGGYKHPNALRYEAALSLANGARCSVGDQLHPEGCMDEATYRLIGKAYADVESKELWCMNAEPVTDIGLLSVEAAGFHSGRDMADRTCRADAGAVRMLLEGKYLFNVIDLEEDFGKYKVIVMPDRIRISKALKAKLDVFLKTGGKLLCTGESGLGQAAGDGFALDLGVKWMAENQFRPDYFRPGFALKSLGNAAFIFYSQGQRVELDGGIELGRREDPYFNREVFRFCSHQHTPDSFRYGGPGMVESQAGVYIAWNVFEDYATKGSLALKETVCAALDRLLPDKTLETNLPAQGIITLTRQGEQGRYVVHLLYASPVKRGEGIEVIEDILPVYNVNVAVRLLEQPKRVVLEPEGRELPFALRNGTVEFTVPRLECHQMVVMEF